MCIRAIDYCPPVDITFGDFLRGVVTADLDFAPADKSGFRIVFIESFREWGIYPRGTRSMGLDALLWPRGADLIGDLAGQEKLVHAESDMKPHLKRFVLQAVQKWNLESNRFEVWKDLAQVRESLWKWLHEGDSYRRDYARLFGLVINENEAPRTVYRGQSGPTVEVHAARPTLRRTVDGGVRTDLVIEVTQRRRGYFDREMQRRMDDPSQPAGDSLEEADFKFRTGCTILIDPRSAEVRRVIRTPGTIANDDELDRVRRFLVGETGILGNAFDAGLRESLRSQGQTARDEPFAMLHQLQED